jgi:putative ABC transport system permease protein
MLQFVSIRASVPEAAVLAAARGVIRRLDPELAITQVRTLRQSVDGAMTFQRDMMLLVGGFAAVTLAMAAIGLGGVMIYVVSRRRREIGLRMALGADRGQIARAVLSMTLRLALAGGILGAAAALASGKLIGSFLHGVGANDPIAMLLAPAVLIAVALLTGVGPALRAASVDPQAAIRQEH